MKPLTDDELWFLDGEVTKGKTVVVWMVWQHTPDTGITKLRAVPPSTIYMDDEPAPLRNTKLSSIYSRIFDNYWHAYAYNLKLKQGAK